MGKQLITPVDPELMELAAAYRYTKLFHCSISEYEERPYEETVWMLQIDATYNDAVQDMND